MEKRFKMQKGVVKLQYSVDSKKKYQETSGSALRTVGQLGPGQKIIPTALVAKKTFFTAVPLHIVHN